MKNLTLTLSLFMATTIGSQAFATSLPDLSKPPICPTNRSKEIAQALLSSNVQSTLKMFRDTIKSVVAVKVEGAGAPKITLTGDMGCGVVRLALNGVVGAEGNFYEASMSIPPICNGEERGSVRTSERTGPIGCPLQGLDPNLLLAEGLLKPGVQADLQKFRAKADGVDGVEFEQTSENTITTLHGSRGCEATSLSMGYIYEFVPPSGRVFYRSHLKSQEFRGCLDSNEGVSNENAQTAE